MNVCRRRWKVHTMRNCSSRRTPLVGKTVCYNTIIIHLVDLSQLSVVQLMWSYIFKRQSGFNNVLTSICKWHDTLFTKQHTCIFFLFFFKYSCCNYSSFFFLSFQCKMSRKSCGVCSYHHHMYMIVWVWTSLPPSVDREKNKN